MPYLRFLLKWDQAIKENNQIWQKSIMKKKESYKNPNPQPEVEWTIYIVSGLPRYITKKEL